MTFINKKTFLRYSALALFTTTLITDSYGMLRGPGLRRFSSEYMPNMTVVLAAGANTQTANVNPTSRLYSPYACRHYATGVQATNYPKGHYTQATEDPIFKHIMSNDKVRNSFLTSIIGENITSSEILDSSLNPIRSYTALRELLNRPEIKKMMEDIEQGEKDIEVLNKKSKRSLGNYKKFLYELSPLYHQLIHAIPDRERNTQLDLVCKTSTGLINVEIQVEPQDFWDIRILDHVCGLFHRQFPRGFKWSQLESDSDIKNTVKRVIGVSIFEKPPINPESIHDLLPWYNTQPWTNKELYRHYDLSESRDPQKKRPGLEFRDYNLSALPYITQSDILAIGDENIQEWLDLLANAHLKSKEETSQSVQNPQVKKAYHMLESGSIPDNIMEEYKEAQKRRYQISHYVNNEKGKSKEEGREEAKLDVARKMISKGKTNEDILDFIDDLTHDQIDALR